MLQIIKTVKTQQSTQNYTTPDNDQKHGQKHLGRIPLPSRSRHEKNNKKSWKNKIKTMNKQCSIVFNKTCLNNNLLPKYTLFYIYIYIYIYIYNLTR